jgi:hypothetical protein
MIIIRASAMEMRCIMALPGRELLRHTGLRFIVDDAQSIIAESVLRRFRCSGIPRQTKPKALAASSFEALPYRMCNRKVCRCCSNAVWGAPFV